MANNEPNSDWSQENIDEFLDDINKNKQVQEPTEENLQNTIQKQKAQLHEKIKEMSTKHRLAEKILDQL